MNTFNNIWGLPRELIPWGPTIDPDLVKALANDSRRRILLAPGNGELCDGALTESFLQQ